MDSIRCSRLVLAFFSWPEYVFTTYHFALPRRDERAVGALFLLATDLPDDLAILHPNLSLKRTGRAGGTRTPNIRFWRPALFHWSYCPTPPSWSKIPALNKQPNPPSRRRWVTTWSPCDLYVCRTSGSIS